MAKGDMTILLVVILSVIGFIAILTGLTVWISTNLVPPCWGKVIEGLKPIDKNVNVVGELHAKLVLDEKCVKEIVFTTEWNECRDHCSLDRSEFEKCVKNCRRDAGTYVLLTPKNPDFGSRLSSALGTGQPQWLGTGKPLALSQDCELNNLFVIGCSGKEGHYVCEPRGKQEISIKLIKVTENTCDIRTG